MERSHIIIGTKKEIAFNFREKESLAPLIAHTMTKFQNNKKRISLSIFQCFTFDIPV